MTAVVLGRDQVRAVLRRDLDLAGTLAALGLVLRKRPAADRYEVGSGKQRMLTSVTAHEVWDFLRSIAGEGTCDSCGAACGSCCDSCGWTRP